MSRSGSSRVRPVPCHRAFTLVEVAVGLALGVLLLVGMQRIVLGAYRTAAVLERRTAAAAAQALPFELLAEDLACRPAGGGLALHKGVLTFSTLHALQTARVAARHAVAVRYRLEPREAGGSALVRTERELEIEGWPDTGVPLTGDVAALAIEIFDGQRWQRDWPLPAPQPARALRVSVEWTNGTRCERVIPLAPLVWRRHDE